MTREIKFRVWSEEDREYRTDCRLKELFTSETGTPATLYSDEGDRFDIEQYTGLKDKNGKEIYEGDILWWEHYYGMTGENKEYTERVYWEEKDASFVVGDWFEPLGHLVDEDAVEVIGNIHENSELIGGEE